MVQIAYRNRELTSYPKINHVFVSSKAVFTAEALSSQYQAAITLCKQSYVDTQYTIKIHNIEINPLAINLDVSGCSGANNKTQIKVKTHRPPCRFSLLSIQWYAISGFDDRRWHSLLPKDNLFKNILNEIIFVYFPQGTMFSLPAAVIIHKRVEPGLCPTEFQT